MKRKLLRMTAAIMTSTLVLTLFAGCGTKPTGSNSSSSTVSQSTVEPLKEVTLKFYFGGDKKSATDEVWTAVSEKFKEQLNAKFEVNFIGFNDYKDKLMLMSASGDNWDANFDANWMAYPQMVNNGAYLALDDLLPKYAPNLYATLQKSGVLGAATVNGKIVCMPWTMKQNLRTFVNWRGDAVQKANITIPKDGIKTVEDFDKYLYEIKNAIPGLKYILPDFNGFPASICSFELIGSEYTNLEFHGFVFSLNDTKCTIKPVEQLPEFLAGVKRYKKLYDDGLIAKDAMMDKTDGGTYWNGGMNVFGVTTHEWANANTPFTDPTWTKEATTVSMYPDKKVANRSALSNAMCINKNAANPERALMFLDMMETSQSLYDMVMYGIEGKTYVLKGDEAAYPTGMTDATSNYMGWGGQWGMWKPQFKRPDSTYSKGFWQRESEFATAANNNVENPLDGLFFDTEAIKNEIAKRDQIASELGRTMMAGLEADAVASTTDYIQKQKAAGLDKIIAELQKQVDAFLANKK